VLAIAGGKGGTGKTTTALGLARALDGRVAVADADVDMPDLHLLAGVDRPPTLGDVADGRAPSTVALPRPDDVWVVPAPTDPDRPVAPALSRLAAAPAFDRVLVDCPGGAGPDAAAPVRAADGVVVVAAASPPALRDATKTAATARAVGTPVVGAVVTRAASPPAATDLFGCPVLGAVPDRRPPVLSRPPVRRAYERVAEALGPLRPCEEI
jgi:septum site-determining protein MinD